MLAPAAMRPFPSLQAAGFAYGRIWADRSLLVPAAGFWVALQVLVTALSLWLGQGEVPPDPDAGAGSFSKTLKLIELMPMLLASVGISAVSVYWQRRILTGATWPGLAAPANWRVFRYLLRTLGLALVAGLPVLVFALVIAPMRAHIGNHGFVLSFLVGLILSGFILARLLPALPAIAMDKPELGFKAVWGLTEGNTMRMAVGVFLTALPILLTGLVVDDVVQVVGGVRSLAGASIAIITEFVQASVMAAYLAFCYDFFGGSPARGQVL